MMSRSIGRRVWFFFAPGACAMAVLALFWPFERPVPRGASAPVAAILASSTGTGLPSPTSPSKADASVEPAAGDAPVASPAPTATAPAGVMDGLSWRTTAIRRTALLPRADLAGAEIDGAEEVDEAALARGLSGGFPTHR